MVTGVSLMNRAIMALDGVDLVGRTSTVQSGVTKATTLPVHLPQHCYAVFWQKMALHSGALEDALRRRVPTCGGSSGHLEQKQIGAHWHPSPSISSEELSDLKPHRSQQSRPYVRALQRHQAERKLAPKPSVVT